MVNSPVLRFIISVLILTGICLFVQNWWNGRMPEHMQVANGWVLPIIFAVIVTVVHLYLLRSAKGDGKAFVRGFMGATMLKFFVYSMIFVVFMLLTTTNQRALAVHFLFYYAVFTVLEVSMLYGELNRMKK